jgi:cell division protease FtsH
MTAVRAPIFESLRSRLTVALVVAAAALAALAAPAHAAAPATTCAPTDQVCLGKPAAAPSPAPANQAAPATPAAAAAAAQAKAADAQAKAAAKAAQSLPPPSVTSRTTFWDDLSSFALTWGPLIFMGAIVVLIGMTLRFMPRTKPQEIKPDTSSSIRWEDVAGADEAKEELREIVEFLRDPKRFKALGAKVPKGVLLHGPPGTGKTLLAKAAANEAKAQFFAQSAASFVEMFAGLGAARIRRLFREARKASPAIIFIDELDAVGTARGNDISGEKDQTLNQLLVEMDGFGTSEDVVVMAASNMLEKLDPALLRPGRFDRQVLVAPPDLTGRQEILRVHTVNKPLRNVDFEIIARQTSGLTGAELANICNEAAIRAGRRNDVTISQGDFDWALERVVAGMQTRKVINDHEKRVIAFHEAGHALCAELLDSQEKTHRISIIPRGKALGYTLHLPQEDRYLKSKAEMMDWMVVGLGGRVAEAIVFEEITTGAANDLEKVYSVSRAMVTDYGMGTSISSRRLPVDDYAVSEASRRIVDEEQQELTDMAWRRGHKLITENRALLDAFAGRLLSNEVLERDDIERLVAEHRAGTLVVLEPATEEAPVAKKPEPGAPLLAATERLDADAPGTGTDRQ